LVILLLFIDYWINFCKNLWKIKCQRILYMWDPYGVVYCQTESAWVGSHNISKKWGPVTWHLVKFVPHVLFLCGASYITGSYTVSIFSPPFIFFSLPSHLTRVLLRIQHAYYNAFEPYTSMHNQSYVLLSFINMNKIKIIIMLIQ